MYIIGLERANLSLTQPFYKLAVADTHGSIITAYSKISRDLLKKIINLPNLIEPAIWSQEQADMLENLTNRKIIALKPSYIKRHNLNKLMNKEQIRDLTPLSLFNYFAYKARMVNSPNADKFELPELITRQKTNELMKYVGDVDARLTILCFNTQLLSIIGEGR